MAAIVPSSSCQSSNSDHGDRSASPAGQKLSPDQQSPPVASALDHIRQKALGLLEEKEQATIRKYITIEIDSTLRNALEAAQKKQEECKSKKWTFSVGKRDVSLQDVAGKVISFLDGIKDVGDIIASVDPIHAGLPWAGIRLLLEV